MAELNEFQIIETYFSRHDRHAQVVLGVGDDAAVVDVPAGSQLVIAMDTLNEGTHFLRAVSAADLGYKALAVNLSDLAAMGAEPAWFTLSLSVPGANGDWLRAFSEGLYEAAAPFDMALIGGDTTRGPTSVTIQVAGYVPVNRYLTRGGASAGDAIYVTGTLGDSRAGLALLQSGVECPDANSRVLIQRHNRPTPRVEQGRQLPGIASACIDISDGLLADLGHIMKASGTGARVNVDALPLSHALHDAVPDPQRRSQYAMSGGEDYELCLCVPQDQIERLEALGAEWSIPLTRIGVMTEGSELKLVNAAGEVQPITSTGYDHFTQGATHP